MKRTIQAVLAVVVSSSVSMVAAQQQKSDTAKEQTTIQEVVLTGYIRQDRRTLTTSISKLNPERLQDRPISNVATALQGAIPGLVVSQTSGQPGTTPTFTLRGGTNFDNSGTPLILIDGVPGSFFALNPNDVESIEVLKDAAATAIYGAQGANGVILVTTKQGKAGRTTLDFNSQTTFHEMPKTSTYMNAQQYVKFNRMAIQQYGIQMNSTRFNGFLNGPGAFPAATNGNTTNSIYTTMFLTPQNSYLVGQKGWETMTDPVTGQELIFMNNNMGNLYFQRAMTKNYNVSASGGTDKANFYAGLGYLEDPGIVFGSMMKRISGTVNASFKIRDNFKITSTMFYTHTNFTPNYLNNDNNIFQRAAGLAPTARIWNNNPDGTLSDVLNPGVGLSFGNPLYYNDKFIRHNLEQRLSTSLQFDYGFAKGFNLTVRGSFRSVNNQVDSFAKAYLDGGTLINSRISSASMTRDLTPQLTDFITYKKDFGKHHIDAMVGHEFKYDNVYSFGASTMNSATDLIPTMNAGAQANGVPTSSVTAFALNSFFTQWNYNYDNKYLLGLTGRIDGSSKLWKDNRYHAFPGVSVGWNLYREDFFSSLRQKINNLKLRASYGETGNVESLGNYTAFGAYSQTATYDSQGGYVLTTLPNQNLVWENLKSFDFGIDLGILNNRITFNGDYYIRTIADKLSTFQFPAWVGISGILQNVGTFRTKGWEFAATGAIIRNSDLQWNVSANYTSFKSYAVKLPDVGIAKNRQGGQQIYDPKSGQLIYVGGLQEGERVGLDLITAYVYQGTYKTQAELDADKNLNVTFSQKPFDRHLGDSRWKDINGDGVIDNKDRVVLGRTTPKFSGGFSTDLNYKGFSFVVRTDFAVGHYKINGIRVKGYAQTQGSQNGYAEIANSWTPDNPNSNMPAYVFTDPMKNIVAGGSDQGDLANSSTLFWEKASYLALREITLGYTFKGSLFNNVVKSLKVYLTGANLYYFTGYSGYNPEYMGNGSDTGSFPIPRTYTVGLDIQF